MQLEIHVDPMVEAYVPGGHDRQSLGESAAPSVEYFPAGQRIHVSTRGKRICVRVGGEFRQTARTHTLAPGDVAAVVEENVPGLQERHVSGELAETVVEYLPAGHAWQLDSDDAPLRVE